jgi:hypothetical protein
VPVVPPVTVSETVAGRPFMGAGGSMLNVAVTDVVPPAGMVVAPTVTVPLVTAPAGLGPIALRISPPATPAAIPIAIVTGRRRIVTPLTEGQT